MCFPSEEGGLTPTVKKEAQNAVGIETQRPNKKGGEAYEKVSPQGRGKFLSLCKGGKNVVDRSDGKALTKRGAR